MNSHGLCPIKIWCISHSCQVISPSVSCSIVKGRLRIFLFLWLHLLNIKGISIDHLHFFECWALWRNIIFNIFDLLWVMWLLEVWQCWAFPLFSQRRRILSSNHNCRLGVSLHSIGRVKIISRCQVGLITVLTNFDTWCNVSNFLCSVARHNIMLCINFLILINLNINLWITFNALSNIIDPRSCTLLWIIATRILIICWIILVSIYIIEELHVVYTSVHHIFALCILGTISMLLYWSLCCNWFNFFDHLELNIWTLWYIVIRLLIILQNMNVIWEFLPIVVHSHLQLHSVNGTSVSLENNLRASFASWRIRLLSSKSWMRRQSEVRLNIAR